MDDDIIETAKQAAAMQNPLGFVREWLLNTTPFAFRVGGFSFAQFRSELADVLGVHPADITLVGSGQLGFSLNPSKLLSPFNSGSDIDVAIVSPSIFDEAWKDLLERHHRRDFVSELEQRHFKKTRENFFLGYLRPDKIPASAQLSKTWFPKLSGPFESPVAKRHSVEAWLFKSWWHFESFYVDNIMTVQPSIAKLIAAQRSRTVESVTTEVPKSESEADDEEGDGENSNDIQG